jgi:hypothetical protein
MPEDAVAKFGKQVPMQRPGQPAEPCDHLREQCAEALSVADVIAFFEALEPGTWHQRKNQG